MCAYERFSDYLSGLEFHIHTDHKPLVPPFGSKNLDELPIRVQHFCLRMMCFKFTISHGPVKSLLVADALSRVPCSEAVEEDLLLQQETASYINSEMEQIKSNQEGDEEYCQSGWPSRQSLSEVIKLYYPVASEISVKDGLLMRGNQVVIPAALRLEMLNPGHQGISKCRECARQSLWWSGLSRQLKELVKNCWICRKQRNEPLIPTALPELPWQHVGLISRENPMC